MQKLGSVRDSTQRLAQSKHAEQALNPGWLLSEQGCPHALNSMEQSRLPLLAGTMWQILGVFGQVSGRGVGKMRRVLLWTGLDLVLTHISLTAGLLCVSPYLPFHRQTSIAEVSMTHPSQEPQPEKHMLIISLPIS